MGTRAPQRSAVSAEGSVQEMTLNKTLMHAAGITPLGMSMVQQ